MLTIDLTRVKNIAQGNLEVVKQLLITYSEELEQLKEKYPKILHEKQLLNIRQVIHTHQTSASLFATEALVEKMREGRQLISQETIQQKHLEENIHQFHKLIASIQESLANNLQNL